ncbi:Uncharacterized protein dnm_027330 [Desulfonema magnum]|uniref:Uncharacterized protein n=1 Tax=Desulfonema magnum TaxID=45655 RepID=A0A975BKF6_9BACT|nr:Uncharacterized protein dnm_027330 [Desulfonema magnum]
MYKTEYVRFKSQTDTLCAFWVRHVITIYPSGVPNCKFGTPDNFLIKGFPQK